MSIIITGNPIDGFAIFGPFADDTSAVEAANAAHLEPDWWVAPLHTADELPA